VIVTPLLVAAFALLAWHDAGASALASHIHVAVSPGK